MSDYAPFSRGRSSPPRLSRSALIVFCLFGLAQSSIHAQAPGLLDPSPSRLFPGADAALSRGIDALRDAVYGCTLSPEEASAAAVELAARVRALPLGRRDAALALSRLEYLAGRAWQPVEDELAERAEGSGKPGTGDPAATSAETASIGAASAGAASAGAAAYNRRADKRRAGGHHEAAIRHAREAQATGDSAEALMAEAAALSQLCILKDFAYLVANGPKVGRLARRALKLDPNNLAAQISLAAAKAYPPAIFGGDPRAAVEELGAIVASRPAGFQRDELFDLRVGIGTAYARMKDAANARRWFSLALELYPDNVYAAVELAKAGGSR